MASITVDIDLDDIDTSDMVREICTRMNPSKAHRARMRESEKRDLQEAAENISQALNSGGCFGIMVLTIDDKMKFEHLSKVFKKYSWAEMEKLLPE